MTGITPKIKCTPPAIPTSCKWSAISCTHSSSQLPKCQVSFSLEALHLLSAQPPASWTSNHCSCRSSSVTSALDLAPNISLLQGIFLTQESNWGLLHCRQILYQLSHQVAEPPDDGTKSVPCSQDGAVTHIRPYQSLVFP